MGATIFYSYSTLLKSLQHRDGFTIHSRHDDSRLRLTGHASKIPVDACDMSGCHSRELRAVSNWIEFIGVSGNERADSWVPRAPITGKLKMSGLDIPGKKRLRGAWRNITLGIFSIGGN